MDKNYREWKRKLGGIFAVIAKTISIFREIFAFFRRTDLREINVRRLFWGDAGDNMSSY